MLTKPPARPIYLLRVHVCLAQCLNCVLNVKALVGAFNQEKALVGAFTFIVKTDYETDKSFYSTSQNIEPM